MNTKDSKPVMQFINSYYCREKYNGKEKICNDALIIAYKENGEQKIQIIEEPKFSFYIAKPNINIPHYIDNIPLEDCDLVTINYKDLNRFLAKFNGLEEQYFKIKTGRYSDFNERRTAQNALINKCQANPRLFGSDIDIEDYYKMEFVKAYGVNIGQYKKAVFDIETDGIGDQFQVKHPVNCLSYYDFSTDTMYGLYWDQPGRWPRYDEFKEFAQSGKFAEALRNDPNMNGTFERNKGKTPKFTCENTKFIFEFYEDELDMLLRFWEILHTTCPDYAMAWNYTFDVLYIINRILKHIEERDLNMNIEDIICDPNIPKKYRYWRFKEDRSERGEYYSKWHYFEIPSKTTFIDSMSMYANIRKSAGVEPSYALNDICMKELGKGKVDYHGIADNAAELPHKDFMMHAHYNIVDTWLLAELEMKNNDIDALMYIAEYTRLSKVTRQTSTLKNAQQQFYLTEGLAIGNNHNALVPQPKQDYVGAMVADVMNNKPISTPLFRSRSSVIRPYIIDYDLTSMYPMIAISHNIYKTTLVFQVVKIGSTSPYNDPNDPGTIDVAEAFDNYQTGNTTRWAHDYLQLPDIGELFSDLVSELKSIQSKGRIA